MAAPATRAVVDAAASRLAETARAEAKALGVNPHALVDKAKGYVTVPRGDAGEPFRVVLTLPRHCSREDAEELMADVELALAPHRVHVEGGRS